MELQQVRYFLALARSLNFTRAAEQCNVTQPALTRAVQRLEDELGEKLVHRERQFTQLTDLGKIILPLVERTLAAADSVRLRAQEFRRKGIAPLKIGLARCVSATLLVLPLAEIARVIPGLRVELVEAPAEQLPALLLEGEINAALCGELDELPERLDRWRLFEERFVILAAAADPLARLHPIPIQALTEAVWLEHIGCKIERRFWDTHFPEGRAPRIAHRGHQESHLQHMVAAGLGIMLAPEHAPHLPSLVMRPIAGDPLRRNVQLLVMAGRRYSPALDAFVKTARLREWKAEIQASLAANGETRPGLAAEKRTFSLERPLKITGSKG